MKESDASAHQGHAVQRAITLPHATHEEWLQVHSALGQLSERCTQLENLSAATLKVIFFVYYIMFCLINPLTLFHVILYNVLPLAREHRPQETG